MAFLSILVYFRPVTVFKILYYHICMLGFLKLLIEFTIILNIWHYSKPFDDIRTLYSPKSYHG